MKLIFISLLLLTFSAQAESSLPCNEAFSKVVQSWPSDYVYFPTRYFACINGRQSACPSYNALIKCGLTGTLEQRVAQCQKMNGKSAGFVSFLFPQPWPRLVMSSACSDSSFACKNGDCHYFVLTKYDGTETTWIEVNTFPLTHFLGDEVTPEPTVNDEFLQLSSKRECWEMIGLTAMECRP